MKERIPFFALLIAFVFVVSMFDTFKSCVKKDQGNKSDTIVKTVTVTHTDTIYHTIEKTVYIDRPTLIKDTAGVKTYADTVKTDFGKMWFTDRVQGVFLDRKIDFKFNVPEIRTNTFINTEKTISRQRIQLFGTSSLFYQPHRFDFNVGVLLVPSRGRWLYGYSYAPGTKTHGATIGYKISFTQ